MFTPTLSRKHIEKELSKLQKLNYNQFRWWRWYEQKNKPLHKNKPFRDKILNGDFDYSCYGIQAMLCEYMMNDLEKELGELDHTSEKVRLLKARRKRLWEDFERDEVDRLSSLIKEFTINYRVDKKQVEEEMMEFSGDSLIDFYYYMDEKYKIVHMPYPLKRRGRPRKYA